MALVRWHSMHSMHEVSATYLCVQPLQGSPPVRHPPPTPAFHTAMIYFNIFNYVASSDCQPIHLKGVFRTDCPEKARLALHDKLGTS